MLQTRVKVLRMYEDCISSVVRVLREGRRDGARDFYITGDLNVELGLMCTNEKDNEELTKMYGPLCWQGYDNDPGGFKKTWSKCGKGREEAFKHRHLRQVEKYEISQLDYIIGPMRRNDEIYIHNEGRLWATLDHFPIFARVQEEAHAIVFQKRIKSGRD